MDNQQTEKMTKKKDPWRQAYREFIGIFYLLCFFTLIGIILIVTKTSSYQVLLNPVYIIESIFLIIVWFYLALLFKKRDKLAITVGYIFLSILAIGSLLPTLNIIGLIIIAYLLWRVHNVSKFSSTIVS